ncbi:MAG: hypothetical protein M1812_003447 [Candelaria pacifica]|nr:MAG: hypothetical protein M1812_003447 [Candelaria pacifica]
MKAVALLPTILSAGYIIILSLLFSTSTNALTTDLTSRDIDPHKIEANSPFAKCHDAGKTWEECNSLPSQVQSRDMTTNPNPNNEPFARFDRGSSPFSDCLNSGKSWDTCHRTVADLSPKQNNIQARADRGSSPFTDCLNGGGSWAKCQSSVHTTKREFPHSLELKRDLSPTADEEQSESTDYGLALRDTPPNFKGQASCYTSTLSKWITNTAITKVKKEACTKTVSGLKTGVYQAFGKKYGVIGAGADAFYYNKAGSYWPVAGNLELKGYKYKIPDNAAELDQKAQGFCEQAVTAFAGDKGAGGEACTTDEKSVWTFKKVGHHAVNGGFYHVTFDGKPVNIDDQGDCTNCALSFNLEWPENLSKDDKQ